MAYLGVSPASVKMAYNYNINYLGAMNNNIKNKQCKEYDHLSSR
jgi:hypothetical protein